MTPHLDEEQSKTRFLAALGNLLDCKEAFLKNCEQVRAMYTDCSAIDTELAELLREIDVVTELTGKCIEENAVNVQSQDDYLVRHNGYVERYAAAKEKVEALEQGWTLRLARADTFDAFTQTVKELDIVPSEFDDKLW